MDTIKALNKIGVALSAEKDADALMSLILSSARQLTGADAGTLYVVDEEQEPPVLRFSQLQNDTLKVSKGGIGSLHDLGFKDIPLDQTDENRAGLVVVHAVRSKQTVNLADVYAADGFDFTGTRAFDQQSGYRSTSMLVVPLEDHQGHVIGALQLINKLDATGTAIAFSDDDEDIAASLASQGGVALTQQQLIKEMQTLFESFTQVIAGAIDSKSPQTGAHCRRVPEATLMLAKAVSRSQWPAVADFSMDEDELYELEMAAWLHDCGKVVTPHHVVEKSTKLETVRDGIETLQTRLEVVRRDDEIASLRAQLEAAGIEPAATDDARWREASMFLYRTNQGSEFTSDEDIAHLQSLQHMAYQDMNGERQSLITEDELLNLSIRRGTLNDDERKIMQDHMVHTIKMLEQMPFPKHLRRVPEYAGGHHERMDGKGYPRGLSRDEMSIPARIMGITDVFEALTAPERSYKKPMPLSQALGIMRNMVKDNHLDPDLFRVFVEEGVYKEYANKFLADSQIDSVDEGALLAD